MRISILPLVIILLCSSLYGFSQGTTCANAITLPVNGSCNSYAMSTGINNAATGTGITCTGTYPTNKRVTWFKFTVATNVMAASFAVTLIDTTTQMQVAFYDQGACGFGVNTANAAICAPAGFGTLMTPGNTPLIPGRTYYVRVYTNGTGTNAHLINICATPVTKQTISVNGSCGIFPLDPAGTGSNPLPASSANSCGYNNDRSVTWFQFTPSANLNCATFTVNVDNGARTEIALYNQAGVYQQNSTLCLPDGNGIWAPGLPFTFTNGVTYYLRVYTENDNTTTHTINICASPYAQPNDLCSSATRLDNNGIQDNNVCATGSVMNGGNEPPWITSNSNPLLCAPQLQNTAWYYFVVNNNTQATIVNVSSVNCDNYGGGGCTGPNCNGSAGIQLGLLQGPSVLTNCVATNAMFVPPNTATHCYQTTATSFGFTVPANASIPNGTKMYIAVDGYSGANCSYTITTTNAIPIPVKLKYFTVWKQAQSNQLRWITSWETNNKNFEIERSLDGKDFVVIGSVPGTGTSSSDVQYKFDDNEAPLLAYYRLKQIDIDGNYEYSNVVIIKRDNIKSLFGLAFENPVHNSGIVTISTERAGTTTLRIVDISGRELATQIVDCGRGNNTVVKDFSRLVAGSYYLIATQGENRVVKPFIKQ